MKSKQTTIRIAKEMMISVDQKLSKLKLRNKTPISFSSYIMILIREDLKRRGELENLTHLNGGLGR